MKPPGADPVMTPRDHGAGGSVGHHQHAASEVPAAVVVTGTGDSIAIGNRVVRRVQAVFASRAR
jgi:hypothetical protein